MKNKNHSSNRILANILLYVLRGLFVWYVIISLLTIRHLIIVAGDDSETYVSLPVIFKSDRIGDLNMENTHINSWFSINNARGNIATNGLPRNVFYISFLSQLLYTTIILLIIHLICKMLKNAREGSFLVYENSIRLRYIALLNLTILLFDKLFLIISSSYLYEKLEFPNIEFIGSSSLWLPQWKQIVLYLFLLIIAESFRMGAQLKEENDLTI